MRNNGFAGFGLLEVVVATAIIATALFAFSGTVRVAYRAAADASDRVRANFLMEEGFEAVKTIRDNGWTTIKNLTLNQTYYLVFSGGQWSATTTANTTDTVFTRSFIVRSISRDASYNIAPSGANDPDARKIELSVSWNERGRALTVSGVTYLENIFLE